MNDTPRATRNASELMMRFADRTGLTSDEAPQRYLWTDAFAVCNFIGLAQRTGEERYTTLAVRLVDQVHDVLGRFRPDDPRSGWISGLSDSEGATHPTRGGLRIGKELPERGVTEPLDERLEWRRDGQYFHYLTKWMHALDQVHRWTGEPHYRTWACELAKTAHDAFVITDRGGLRMAWKMSTDLSRPLVPTMGHHDPLDGFITCMQLEMGPPEQDDFARMMKGRDWATSDPLGLGGLLVDASRLVQLKDRAGIVGTELLRTLLNAAGRGLASYVQEGGTRGAASSRLAFRELGLAIGLRAVAIIEWESRARLEHYTALGSRITDFWLDRQHQQASSWLDHRDINEVMLATSLVPDGFVLVRPT